MAEITSFADVLGGLTGIAIGVLVIWFRRSIARFAAEAFHMRNFEPALGQIYAALGVVAILIGGISIFIL